MIAGFMGGQAAEKVLLYMANYGEGYAQGIANTFQESLSAIQRQLQKFERAGLLVSQLKGRTRLYLWNPRFPLKSELLALLLKALDLLPDAEKKAYFRQRTRPRRAGKP